MLARKLVVRDAILDGEIVVMGEGGPKFNELMMNREPASYVAFDLLWLNGRDLRELPLWRRKRALEKLVTGSPVGYVDATDDPRLMDAVARMDLEGVVAKRRSDSYSQATDWLKIKHATYRRRKGGRSCSILAERDFAQDEGGGGIVSVRDALPHSRGREPRRNRCGRRTAASCGASVQRACGEGEGGARDARAHSRGVTRAIDAAPPPALAASRGVLR